MFAAVGEVVSYVYYGLLAEVTKSLNDLIQGIIIE